VAGADRLVVASRLSITQMLPYSLGPRIEATSGVAKVAHAAWFGGIYQDPKNFFPNFSVGPNYFELYPEYRVPPAQLKAYAANRSGAIVGAALAKRHGWKVGDTIPLQATIFPTKGSNDWSFRLEGIFAIADAKRRGEENQLLFHWDYFDEANDRQGRSLVHRLTAADDRGGPRDRCASENPTTRPDPDRAGIQPGVREAVRRHYLIVTAIMGACSSPCCC
jgi:hypothetical protein